MYILAIETTGPVGSVSAVRIPEEGSSAGSQAVSSAGIPVKVTTKTMSHLKNLIPMTAELLDEQGIDKKEIAAVAASVGPGSFTGIRIGVSTARALAQAWDVPCIAVPSLEDFRKRAENEPVCVIFNARRGQVYGACYGAGGEALIEPGPYMLSDMLSRIETLRISPVFYGDGIDAYFDTDEFRERVSIYKTASQDERYQTAQMTAEYALSVWMGGKAAREAAGEAGDTAAAEDGEIRAEKASGIVKYGRLLPDYMRESEAEQRLKDGSLEKMRKAKLERLMRMAGK